MDKERKELLWKQYELNIKMYRDYLELVLKMNVFYYAVTGAIVSYYLSHTAQAMAKYALWLPILMSLSLAILFFIGAMLVGVTRRETFKIRDELQLYAAPEMRILTFLLAIFAGLKFVVAIGLLILVFCPCLSN